MWLTGSVGTAQCGLFVQHDRDLDLECRVDEVLGSTNRVVLEHGLGQGALVKEYPSRVPEPFGGEGVWEEICEGDWGHPGPILGKKL